MVLLTSVFLYNLLCAAIPCDPILDPPEPRVKKMTKENELTSPVENTNNPLVVTNTGGLEGYNMYSTEGRHILAFEGIPYAEPPVGELRFKSPVPKNPWIGVKSASRMGPKCLQISMPNLMRVLGNEDCLYLNVYTRQLGDYMNRQKLLPVIFLIHGGSYYFGSGEDFGPAYLLNHDSILITFNYRLGVLGFMSSGDSASPGNYGLKDQSLALKWVSDNIHFFGGDAKRITIMGHSSAASSAHLHSMSPKSWGLFQNGVSFSGSAFTHWAIKSKKQSQRLTDKIASISGCNTRNTTSMVQCLRNQDSVSLVASTSRLLDWVPFPTVVFAPVIEPEGPDAFLTMSPKTFYDAANRTGAILKPWIFGITSNEGYLGILLMRLLAGELSLRYRWSDYAPSFLDFQHTAKDPAALANKLGELYFGSYNARNVPSSYIAQLFGDRLYLHGVYKAISLHSRLAPTYAYLFQYQGKFTASNLYDYHKYEWGVAHSEDLYYYVNSTTHYPGFKRTDKEYQLSHVMTTLVKTFAETGTPMMTTDSGKYVRVWDPIDPNDIKFLRVDTNMQMIPQPMVERYRLWDNFTAQEKLDLNLA